MTTHVNDASSWRNDGPQVSFLKRVVNTNRTNLTGKRVLLFAPSFFGYEALIKQKIEEMGGYCDLYNERSVTSGYARAVLKVVPAVFNQRSKTYYREILESNSDKDYDYVLILKCDMTPNEALGNMKRMFPNAKMCLALWDSIANIPGVVDKFPYFDTIHSFDPDDCVAFQELKYRPLFFSDEYANLENHSSHMKYDICFVGTIHSDRYKIVSEVQQVADSLGLTFTKYCYLQAPFIYKCYKAVKPEFKNTSPDDFAFQALCQEETSSMIRGSRAVLDINHPKQSGLTMRTIEMVGMGKKLLTTNKFVTKADFYNPNNICVIEREGMAIDKGFFETNYEALPSDIYERYTLKSWLLDVLS